MGAAAQHPCPVGTGRGVLMPQAWGCRLAVLSGQSWAPGCAPGGQMDGWTGGSLLPSPTYPDNNEMLSNPLLPPPLLPKPPLGTAAAHMRAHPTCQGAARILKSGWSISDFSWEPGGGPGDVGQQDTTWCSRDTSVGVPGDVLKAKSEGREFEELGRAKCKACEVTEELV